MSIPTHKPKTSLTRSAGWLFALLVLIMLLTAGCLRMEPEETEGITPPGTVPANSAVVESTLAVPSPALTQPPTEPVPVVSVPSKKITISRPNTLKVFSRSGLPAGMTASVQKITDAGTACTINSYLRWESVRARTNKSETARIEGLVKDIDTAIGSTMLTENLVLYCGVTGDQPQRIITERRYTEEGYVSCSCDPSVLYHAMAGPGRDREGYVSLIVLDQKPGSHLLYLNETSREVLLPRAQTWELTAEERTGLLEFSPESVPRYQDDTLEQVRLLNMTQIT